jgi:TRAP-type C4-dicarboxylate transport system permease small subunit
MDARPLLIAIAAHTAMAVLGAILAGGSWRPWHSALRKPRLAAPLPAFAVVGVAVAGGQFSVLLLLKPLDVLI